MNIRFCIVVLLFTAAANSVFGAGPTAEEKLLEKLQSPASVAEKANACRELKLVGTEKSIPILAALLTDPELSHTARYALESMPSVAAGAALRDALRNATGPARSGIIDSLGQRRDPLAIELIAADLRSKDMVLLGAAATALGKIGTPEAATLLTAAHGAQEGTGRSKIDDGLLIAADRLRAAGNLGEAAKIYAELSNPDEPRSVRYAAIRGGIRTSGPAAASIIDSFLSGGDSLHRSAAAAEIPSLSAAGLDSIAGRITNLPPQSQVAVLAAIRIRGQTALGPAVLAACDSPDPAVRLAAVRALGTMGDVSALPLLVKLTDQEGPLGDAARQTLQIICGAKIDEQIFAALQTETNSARRAAWIGVIETRRAPGSVPVLLGVASSQDPLVAVRALEALGRVASPKDVPALVAVVLKGEKGPVRDEAERAVQLLSLQIAEKMQRADPVLSIFQSASAAERLVLLPLLGRIGGAKVRPLIQAALESQDPAQYAAGVRAISNWPDATAADQLLGLAETAQSAEHREWALHAFVRVVSQPGGATNVEKVAKLKRAMELSRSEDQRQWVIQRAAAVRAVETLRFVAPYLDQPALAQQACDTVAELAHHKELRNPHQAEFAVALKKVLATAKDPGLLERVKRYLDSQ